jgi:hypothetical protein
MTEIECGKLTTVILASLNVIASCHHYYGGCKVEMFRANQENKTSAMTLKA